MGGPKRNWYIFHHSAHHMGFLVAASRYEVRARRGVDLMIEEGSWVIVIETSGSGKSTRLNAVAGTFFLDSGKVRVDGQDVTGGWRRCSWP